MAPLLPRAGVFGMRCLPVPDSTSSSLCLPSLLRARHTKTSASSSAIWSRRRSWKKVGRKGHSGRGERGRERESGRGEMEGGGLEGRGRSGGGKDGREGGRREDAKELLSSSGGRAALKEADRTMRAHSR
eukprot:1363003-Rhodomonas_salina.1